MRFLNLLSTSSLSLAARTTSRRSLPGTTTALAAAESSRRSLSSASLPPDRPVRWGILSAGKISSDFAGAIAATPGAAAAAVAARSSDRASAFADRHGIPTVHGTYDELLSDPDVDVVYVGSIADEHAALASRSLMAGKPTVVEKPLTTSLEETRELVWLARKTGTFLMEGMWTRCFPAMRKVRDVIARGDIGPIAVVQGDFGWSTSGCPPDDRIWNPRSGGMTLDIGMYMAQIGQVAFPNADVGAVQAMGTKRNGVDHTVLANVRYSKMRMNGDASGGDLGEGMLQFYVTGDANTEERVLIQGSKGRIVLDPPAHIPSTVRVFYDEGRGIAREEVYEYPLPDDSHAEWNYPGSIGFTHQISEVGKAIRAGERECRHFTLNDSIQVASILDEVLGQVHGASSGNESDSDSDAEMADAVATAN